MKDEISNPIKTGTPYNHSERDWKTNTQVPIRKGCENKQCFCTGKCQEIIGWREKLPNETIIK